MSYFKEQPFRNKRYTNWVKSLPCCLCGSQANDPHHGIALGYGEGGTATKACDLLTMPLCRPCHTEIHNNPELWPDQWHYIAKTLQKAIKDDIISDLVVEKNQG